MSEDTFPIGKCFYVDNDDETHEDEIYLLAQGRDKKAVIIVMTETSGCAGNRYSDRELPHDIDSWSVKLSDLATYMDCEEEEIEDAL